MRDVSHKVSTLRTARARAVLKVSPSTIEAIRTNTLHKGDPLSVAKVAAVQAAKNTSLIIPYCHPMPVEYVGVEFHLDEDSIAIECEVKAVYKTGVEMEALTAASAAALTIYDMAKMVDDLMQIENCVLLSKTGGKSDYAMAAQDVGRLKAAVIVLSDSISAGKAVDASGKLIQEALAQNGYETIKSIVLKDDESEIVPIVRRMVDEEGIDLILTTGGTGLGPRDVTPDALKRLFDKDLPGVTEAIRKYGQERMTFAMLSRSVAGMRGKSIIISLPGSTGGVKDGLNVLFTAITHAFKIIAGGAHGERSMQESR